MATEYLKKIALNLHNLLHFHSEEKKSSSAITKELEGDLENLSQGIKQHEDLHLQIKSVLKDKESIQKDDERVKNIFKLIEEISNENTNSSTSSSLNGAKITNQSPRAGALKLSSSSIFKDRIGTITTDAYMTLANDTPSPLSVTISNVEHMEHIFPSLSLSPFQTSDQYYVEASFFLDQSSFNISYDSWGAKVDIGEGLYKTGVEWVEKNSSGNTVAAAVLAPTKSFFSGVDYQFYFFCGPTILPPLVNSAIAANVNAMVAYVATANPILDFDSWKIQLRKLEPDVSCSYAAAKMVNPTSFSLNLIFTFNVTISLDVWDHNSIHLGLGSIALTGSLLLQVNVDGSTPSIVVTNLACSLSQLVHEGSGTGFLHYVLQGLDEFVARHVASLINTTKKAEILSAINKLFSDILAPHPHPHHPKDAPDATSPPSTTPPTTNLDDVDQSQTSQQSETTQVVTENSVPVALPVDLQQEIDPNNIDYTRWMSNTTVQSKKFIDIHLPGTHDSATYGLTHELSAIYYPGIEFLWKLEPSPAPATGRFPFHKNGKIHVGKDLYAYVMSSIKNISKAQDQTILQQLNAGIRYFDWRVYFDTKTSPPDFYTQHALRGPKVSDMLDQLLQFLQNSDSHEFVIVELSHSNFTPEYTRNATALIQRIIPDKYIYMPPFSKARMYSLSHMNDIDIHTITGYPKGNSKVMFINTDECVYTATVVNAGAGFADSGRGVSGVDSVEKLISEEAKGLKKQKHHKKRPYHICWTLTPQVSDVIKNVVDEITDNKPYNSIRRLAGEANLDLPSFINDNTIGKVWNLVTCDWYNYSDVVPFVVKANFDF